MMAYISKVGVKKKLQKKKLQKKNYKKKFKKNLWSEVLLFVEGQCKIKSRATGLYRYKNIFHGLECGKVYFFFVRNFIPAHAWCVGFFLNVYVFGNKFHGIIKENGESWVGEKVFKRWVSKVLVNHTQ